LCLPLEQGEQRKEKQCDNDPDCETAEIVQLKRLS
jgi:hypothetical protein